MFNQNLITMKHLQLLFALCLLSANFANAQSIIVEKAKMEIEKAKISIEKNFDPPKEFYTRHGFTLSNVSNIDHNYKLSFHIGFGYEFQISSFYSLQPEAIFSRQGSTAVIDGVRIRNRLNYINIPVVSRFFITPKLSLDVAPQLGLLASARVKTKGDKNNRNIKILSSEDFNTTEFGVGLGTTYKICEDTHIMFRYTQGLTNVYKKSYIGDRNTRNSTFEISFIFR